jgi:hypothetical protein
VSVTQTWLVAQTPPSPQAQSKVTGAQRSVRVGGQATQESAPAQTGHAAIRHELALRQLPAPAQIEAPHAPAPHTMPLQLAQVMPAAPHCVLFCDARGRHELGESQQPSQPDFSSHTHWAVVEPVSQRSPGPHAGPVPHWHAPLAAHRSAVKPSHTGATQVDMGGIFGHAKKLPLN